MLDKIFEELKEELGKIKDKVLGILVYGSYASREATERSDIDICVVAGYKDKEKINELYREILRIMAKSKKYDIRIFELMPLWLKIEVIENGKIIYAKSIPELTYYFYFYRKLWDSQAVVRLFLG